MSLKSVSGKAKILGTLLGIGGAMILTFYKGIEVKLWSTNSHFLKQTTMGLVIHDGQNRLVGSFLALGSCFSYAAWLIVQVIVLSSSIKLLKNMNIYGGYVLPVLKFACLII